MDSKLILDVVATVYIMMAEVFSAQDKVVINITFGRSFTNTLKHGTNATFVAASLTMCVKLCLNPNRSAIS